MTKKEALSIYSEFKKKYAAYYYVLALASYDSETIAPPMGTDLRNQNLAYMSGEAYKIQTDPQYIEAIQTLAKLDLGQQLNREIYIAKKDLDVTVKFTREETMEYSLATMQGVDNWTKAKRSNNYALFEPYLLNLIELNKKRANKRDKDKAPYDVVLDDFEEGMTMKKYDEFFEAIKKNLLPLIKKVNDKKDFIKDDFLYKYYPKDKQEKFMKEVLIPFLKFDQGWSYMGVSEHPFTNGFSENDVRITTAYDEYNITTCMFSIIHEVGHAYYMHQVDHKYQATPIANGISSGMHESQSRFLENYIGRRKSFWTTIYPKLQKAFPENLADVSLDEFYKAINVAKSSLIRTDADELTYPIHILIRYEIEKGIFDGSISTENLNKTWNKKYKDYLGVDVPSDSKGILQDIHWSEGYFGYFPTYALGSAIGAQLLNKVEKDIDIDKLLEKGKLIDIEKYLKKNLQKYGALYDYNGLLKLCTGETFKPKYYINYLTKKYKALYKVK